VHKSHWRGLASKNRGRRLSSREEKLEGQAVSRTQGHDSQLPTFRVLNRKLGSHPNKESEKPP